MFANFIYFLVALILYSTSEFPGTTGEIPDHAGLTGLFLTALFYLICRLTFNRLEQRAKISGTWNVDHLLDKNLSRLSILALFLFAADIYVLRLNLLFDDFKIFKIFPTFEAVLFLSLFLFYLVIVWNAAWKIQKNYFADSVSQKNFVISNISFSLPALLPWFLLSCTADLIELIPFEQPGKFLSTPQGEILYVLIFLVAVACFGPLLIQKIWRCKSLEPGPVRNRIETMCSKAGLPYNDILKWELFGGSMITAGVMGLWGKFRYILVTPAMTTLLKADEIDSVIAHEIGHIQKKHIHFYVLFFAGYIACVYSIFDPLFLVVYTAPIIKLTNFAGIAPDTAITLMLSLVLIVLFLLYFRYVFGFYMRNFERQADIHAYKYMPNAQSLINTFYKIASFSRHSKDKPNWHHYSISQRIAFLEKCEIKPELIEKHNKKVTLMIQIYLLAIVLICFTGYHFNFGAGKDGMNRFIAEKLITRQLSAEPDNIEVLLLAGDYFYNEEHFEKAVQLYMRAIQIQPENPHALNNLAWLYATSSVPAFRNPQKALELATKAVALDRSAHILDTYAEACFLNNQFENALTAAKEALYKAPDRQAYYIGQVKRFEKIIVQ